MERIDYAQAVSRLRALETKLLDKAKFDRMIDSSSAEDALKILLESEYTSSSSSIKRGEDYELLLSEELKKLYALMYKVSPEPLLVDIMTLKYDYHNMKVMLKGKALGKDLKYLLVPVGSIDIEKLNEYVLEEKYGDLTLIMREALEKVEKSFKEYNDPQKIDIILDSALYKDMLYRAENLGEKFIIDYIRTSIDLNNIKTLLRTKKQKKDREFLNDVIIDGGTIDPDVFKNYLNDSVENFVSKLSYTDYSNILKTGIDEYNKNGRLNIFEKLSDNLLMERIKTSKYISFGVEPLVAYIYAKENEIKAIRIIMVGKLNNVSEGVIRERLRDIYV